MSGFSGGEVNGGPFDVLLGLLLLLSPALIPISVVAAAVTAWPVHWALGAVAIPSTLAAFFLIFYALVRGIEWWDSL